MLFLGYFLTDIHVFSVFFISLMRVQLLFFLTAGISVRLLGVQCMKTTRCFFFKNYHSLLCSRRDMKEA
jgi:hypothetical protein